MSHSLCRVVIVVLQIMALPLISLLLMDCSSPESTPRYYVLVCANLSPRELIWDVISSDFSLVDFAAPEGVPLAHLLDGVKVVLFGPHEVVRNLGALSHRCQPHLLVPTVMCVNKGFEMK